MNSTNGLTLRLYGMNKRIKELVEQATTYIDPSANDGVCWNFDKEKFAELIVQECASIVYKTDTDHSDCLASLLLHTFGVEE